MTQSDRDFLTRHFGSLAAVHDEDLSPEDRVTARRLEGLYLSSCLIRQSGGAGRKTDERPGTWWGLTLRGARAVELDADA